MLTQVLLRWFALLRSDAMFPSSEGIGLPFDTNVDMDAIRDTLRSGTQKLAGMLEEFRVIRAAGATLTVLSFKNGIPLRIFFSVNVSF